MKRRSQAAALIAIAAAPVTLLAGCGTNNASGASGTLARIQPTSFVTQLPATTTTTTTTLPDPNAPAGPQFADGEQSYTVVSGDSVFGIASKHDVDPDVLAVYNKWPEGISHTINPGDVILIPPGALIPVDEPELELADPAAPASGGAATGGCTYTIQAGDNPSKVAEKFEVTLADLIGINPESVMNSFLVGGALVIPPGGNCDQ